MGQTYRVRYKNHATPQEQIASGGRWYLDSDSGRKLSGLADIVPAATGTLTEGTSISTSATQIASDKDFVYVKNTGTDSVDLLVTLDSSNYLIVLSDGEAFASQIDTDADVRIKTPSGTTTAEYYVTT
jgi:hypothetical protein